MHPQGLARKAFWRHGGPEWLERLSPASFVWTGVGGGALVVLSNPLGGCNKCRFPSAGDGPHPLCSEVSALLPVPRCPEDYGEEQRRRILNALLCLVNPHTLLPHCHTLIITLVRTLIIHATLSPAPDAHRHPISRRQQICHALIITHAMLLHMSYAHRHPCHAVIITQAVFPPPPSLSTYAMRTLVSLLHSHRNLARGTSGPLVITLATYPSALTVFGTKSHLHQHPCYFRISTLATLSHGGTSCTLYRKWATVSATHVRTGPARLSCNGPRPLKGM